MRLNKYLATAQVASRRKCDDIIKEGRVKVNGKTVTELGVTVNEKKDKVSLDGVQLSLPSSFVYLKLNKPKGYACTNSDEKGRKTIFDLVDCDERIFSIGRLDYDTEGLIILTNDGDYANKVAHPRYHLEKEYKVAVKGQIKESELAVMRNGVVVKGERMPSCKIKFLSYENDVTKLSVTIDEGQNRQIRRMFEAIGKEITLLKRVRIGSVRLGGLKRGEWRDMTQDEISALVGGK